MGEGLELFDHNTQEKDISSIANLLTHQVKVIFVVEKVA